MVDDPDEIRNVERVALNDDYKCTSCNSRVFATFRGLKIHYRACTRKTQPALPSSQPVAAAPVNELVAAPVRQIVVNQELRNVLDVRIARYKWGDKNDHELETAVDIIYDKVVYWRKNLFMLPTGKAGKDYVQELTRLINAWTNKEALRNIAIKAIHVMPNLLLQKPHAKSKSSEHLKALKRRIALWKAGDLNELLFECETIQKRLKSFDSPKSIGEISKKFVTLMSKGNVNGALKLLTNSMSNGILPLNDETLKKLQSKHPAGREITQDALLTGEVPQFHPVIFDSIDEEMVRKAAIKTKGGSGPSGLDADGWRRILTSSSFGQCTIDLRKAIAEMTKKMCTEKLAEEDTSLESHMACRLIPLNKNPGVRPIGVGEVLRRIMGKITMQVLKEDVRNAAGCLQLCAGFEAGSEAAIHAMHDIFAAVETEQFC